MEEDYYEKRRLEIESRPGIVVASDEGGTMKTLQLVDGEGRLKIENHYLFLDNIKLAKVEKLAIRTKEGVAIPGKYEERDNYMITCEGGKRVVYVKGKKGITSHIIKKSSGAGVHPEHI